MSGCPDIGISSCDLCPLSACRWTGDGTGRYIYTELAVLDFLAAGADKMTIPQAANRLAFSGRHISRIRRLLREGGWRVVDRTGKGQPR